MYVSGYEPQGEMMDKNEAKAINKEVSDFMNDLAKRYGVSLTKLNLSYTDNNLEWKIAARKNGEDGKIGANLDMEPKAKREVLVTYNNKVKPEKIIGETFEVNRLGSCQIVDFRPRAKYKFVVSAPDGQKYAVPTTSIKW